MSVFPIFLVRIFTHSDEYGSSLIYRNFNEPSIKVHNASKIYGLYSDLTFEGDDGDDELIFTDASHGVA